MGEVALLVHRQVHELGAKQSALFHFLGRKLSSFCNGLDSFETCS